MYFTGCAGNITAGKYNDGAVENRALLRDRIYRGMVDSEASIEKVPVSGFDWRTVPVPDCPVVWADTYGGRSDPPFGKHIRITANK